MLLCAAAFIAGNTFSQRLPAIAEFVLEIKT
jgi:hypothetical protein